VRLPGKRAPECSASKNPWKPHRQNPHPEGRLPRRKATREPPRRICCASSGDDADVLVPGQPGVSAVLSPRHTGGEASPVSAHGLRFEPGPRFKPNPRAPSPRSGSPTLSRGRTYLCKTGHSSGKAPYHSKGRCPRCRKNRSQYRAEPNSPGLRGSSSMAAPRCALTASGCAGETRGAHWASRPRSRLAASPRGRFPLARRSARHCGAACGRGEHRPGLRAGPRPGAFAATAAPAILPPPHPRRAAPLEQQTGRGLAPVGSPGAALMAAGRGAEPRPREASWEQSGALLSRSGERRRRALGALGNGARWSSSPPWAARRSWRGEEPRVSAAERPQREFPLCSPSPRSDRLAKPAAPTP